MAIGARDSTRDRWIMFRNTHLQAPLWVFRRVIRDDDYDRLLGNINGHDSEASGTQVDRVLKRTLWLWPRIDDARGWAEASSQGKWGPEHYLHYEPARLLRKVMETVPKDASIVDLGCNCGSDLDILRKAGYTNLSGVDAGREAIRLFETEFPETFAMADVKHDLFQRYLLRTPNGAFDYVYSNGATIELVHPSFPVVDEICRIARKGVLLELSERAQGYPRDYVGQFARNGFTLDYLERDPHGTSTSSLVVFRRVAR